jgi:hypothetical protein
MRIITFIILSITRPWGSLTRRHANMSNSTTGVLGLCDYCPDTPLSTTGNTITLPTFAGGLCAAYAAYAAAVWGAGREIQYTIQEVKQIYNKNKTLSLSLARDLIRRADLENYGD